MKKNIIILLLIIIGIVALGFVVQSIDLIGIIKIMHGG
jgi:hypothetical protein